MSEHEIWHVKLGTGETRSGTLDQLDDAFQAGAIDERTLVRRDGTDEWITLAQAAGVDEPPPVHSAPAPTVSAPPPPVTNDLDLDDLDENALRRSSKKSYVVAGIAAAAVFALAGVFVFRASGEADSRAAAAAVPPPPVAADLAQAVATTKTDDPLAAPQRTLTDEQKKALLQADQQRQDDARKKALSRPRAMPTVPSKNPFHKGGDKYDPLNSSL